MTERQHLLPRRAVLSLALAAGSALTLLGGVKASAQNAAGSPVYGFDPATYSLAHGGSGSGSSPASTIDYAASALKELDAEAAQNAKKSPPKTIIVDTAENRQFANRIYATAFAGIDKVLKSQGKDAALTLSQNPQNNPALMTLIKQAHEGQYLLAASIN
jgi:septal ring-binding cell division protein DamX